MNRTVSIITVTKNRPRFIQHLRHNIESLDYDKDLIEWVVVDDARPPYPNTLGSSRFIVG